MLQEEAIKKSIAPNRVPFSYHRGASLKPLDLPKRRVLLHTPYSFNFSIMYGATDLDHSNGPHIPRRRHLRLAISYEGELPWI